jgi:subfamily B ATP-binding cassette protein MsbA
LKEIAKKYLKSNFHYLHFFFSVLRVKLFFVFLISLLYGLVDAVSLTIFIPLFQIATKERGSTNEKSNDVFIDVLNFFHINPTVNAVLIIMLASFILKAIFRYSDVYYRVITTSYFVKKIRNKLLLAISEVKYSKFVTINFGTIQNSVTSEINNINSAFLQYISVIQSAIFVLVYISLSFCTNPKFTVIVIIGGWLSRYLFKTLYANSEKISNNIAKKNNVLSGLVMQHIVNFKYLKSTGLIKSYLNKINTTVDEIENDVIALGKTSAKVMSLREPIIVLFLVAAIYLQINILGGKFNALIIILLFFYRAFGSLITVQQSWTAFLKYVGSITQYIRFISDVNEYKEQNVGEKFGTFRDKIVLKEVSFEYHENAKILHHVSIDIKKNTTVAFVGKSGSGKTTIANIISGLLTPTSGLILIDDVPMDAYSIDSVRSKIGFISQETVVFNDTLFNNITFWQEKNESTLKSFYEVIEKVDLTDFVQNSELKEDIVLGDNGVVMSGGQRQRLSIARELFKEIEILILDEATSSLDSQTERFIQDSIEMLNGKITILVIAHRLSTIKSADKIILIEKGRVMAEGLYDKLISESEMFSNMVSLQEL